MKTKCECPFAGYCPRHQINKSEVLYDRCQNNPVFFDSWERGVGPMQIVKDKAKPRPPGPGTILSHKLQTKGYAPTKGCKCKSKIRLMDIWGPERCIAELGTIVSWLRESAKEQSIAYTAAAAIPGISYVMDSRIESLVVESINESIAYRSDARYN